MPEFSNDELDAWAQVCARKTRWMKHRLAPHRRVAYVGSALCTGRSAQPSLNLPLHIEKHLPSMPPWVPVLNFLIIPASVCRKNASDNT